MKYIYYASEKGNFGDDLNPWLWKQFFGEPKQNDSTAFLGIGSILHNDIPLIQSLSNTRKKIVFGSGVRPSYSTFKIDESWDIRFLRGPLSAATFENRFKYIADAAYAMRLLDNFKDLRNVEKKHEVGLMPYFKSMEYFDWEKICSELGYHFISPHSERGVEYTIQEISSCKSLITEAMHGAIVADILRVPWNRYILSTPFTEGSMVSEFKWMDWLHSINLGGIDTTFIKFYRKSALNSHLLNLSSNIVNAEFLFKSVVRKDILRSLGTITKFYLSNDSIVNDIDRKLNEEITILKNELLLQL